MCWALLHRALLYSHCYVRHCYIGHCYIGHCYKDFNILWNQYCRSGVVTSLFSVDRTCKLLYEQPFGDNFLILMPLCSILLQQPSKALVITVRSSFESVNNRNRIFTGLKCLQTRNESTVYQKKNIVAESIMNIHDE